MSYVFASPEWVSAAATDLASIGSSIDAARAAAAMPTSGVMPAGADEVSAVIAAMFGAHAQAYQQLSAQAAAFHQQFVQLMSSGANQYAGAEAANAMPMQPTATHSSEAGLAAAGRPVTGGSANGVGRTSGSLFSHGGSSAATPTGGPTGFFGHGGGGGVGAISADSQAAVAPAGDVGAASNAGTFAPGFLGTGGLGAATGLPASQAARGGNGENTASTPHVQHAEAVGPVADADRSGWLYGDGAPALGAPAGQGVGPGLFAHSGAGASGVLGQQRVAAPA